MTDTQRSAAPDYQLADRYRREEGRVFLSGLQAIARLPVDQLRIDRRNGLTTAAFISGYQGSPVGMFREEVDRAIATVPDLPIVNQPGLNEELAATSVMGSQLTVNFADCKYDGVMGMWYGKGPGIDRAGDAIRHAVFAGTSPHGGVVALVGDDPAAKSSTLPSSSDATMVDLHMPLIFPGDSQEALDLARHAIALSRACGLWAGLKLTSPIADGTGTVDVSVDRVVPHIPTVMLRRQAVPSAPQRPADRALHGRHGARVPRGAHRSRPPVRRAQPAQPGHRAHRRRLDRHRRLRPHVPRGTRGAAGARVRRRAGAQRCAASGCSS